MDAINLECSTGDDTVLCVQQDDQGDLIFEVKESPDEDFMFPVILKRDNVIKLHEYLGRIINHEAS